MPAIIGNANEVIDTVAAYRDAGVSELMVPDFTLGELIGAGQEKMDLMDRFINEVAPAINQVIQLERAQCHRSWKVKVVIVTGGAGGIGSRIARAFGRAGAKVVIASRSMEKAGRHRRGDSIPQGQSCLAIACDVTDPEQVEQMVADTVREVWRTGRAGQQRRWRFVHEASRGNIAG